MPILYDKSAALLKITSSKGSGGSPVFALSSAIEFPCALQEQSVFEGIERGKPLLRKVGMIYLEGSTLAGLASPPAIDDRIGIDGETYRVVGEPMDPSGEGRVYQIEVRKSE